MKQHHNYQQLWNIILIISFVILMSFGSYSTILSQTDSGVVVEFGTAIWSPDGQMIASAANDGQFRIWDVETGKLLLDLQEGQSLGAVAWNPDSRRIAAGGGDGIIYIWDMESTNPNKPVAKLNDGIEPYIYPIVSVTWSLDGKRLVSAIQVGGNNITLWNMETYSIIGTYDSGEILQTSWHPSLNLPSFAVTTKGVYILNDDLTAHQITADMSADSFAWSTDGKKLAVGDSFAELQLLDGETGAKLSILKGHTFYGSDTVWMLTSSIRALAWNPDNRLLASTANDKTVRVWDTVQGKQLAVFQNDKRDGFFTVGLSWSSYGGRLVFPANPSSYEKNRQLAPTIRTVEDETIQIVVPSPSLDQISDIASLCLADSSVMTETTSVLSSEKTDLITLNTLPNFITQVEALPEGAIPSACATDLIAVAEAIIAQP